jgi:peptide chain release factor 1
MSFQENLAKILLKQSVLSEKLSSGLSGEEFVKSSKEYAELVPIVEKIIEYNKVITDLKSAKELSSESGLDNETKDMIEEELRALNAQLSKLENEVKICLLPKDAADKKGGFICCRFICYVPQIC